MNKVAQAFSAAAAHYDAHAQQQRTVLEAAVQQAMPYVGVRAAILDAGCGTGYLQQYCDKRALAWDIDGIDIAPAMCAQSGAVVGDMCALPFAEDAYDVWFSSLALQWVDAPAEAFCEAARVVKAGGYMVFTCYVEGTLQELQTAFRNVDESRHVLAFHRSADLLAQVRKAGFDIVETQCRMQPVYYPTVAALLANIKGVGASAGLRRTKRSLMTPRQYAVFEAAYEQSYLDGRGVRASWNTLSCIARKGAG